MMTDETPSSYGTAQDPRPTLAQVLAGIEAANAYWAENDDNCREERKAA